MAEEDDVSDEAKSATATKKAPAKRPPRRPSGAKKATKAERRFFLFDALGAAWTMFTLAVTTMTLGTVRFMFPNVLAEPPTKFNVGPPDQFDAGQVDNTWKNKFQVWIVNLAEERKLIALSTICTHLGCSPSWLESEQKFKCPCHGSGFYKTGINFEGPAPRPLERFRIFLNDGVVTVDKSSKFQYELQQWDNPDSFIEV